MARFRTPANVQLHRAQLILLLAALVPTILLIATGIVLLAINNDTPSLVAGVLVLAFCTTSLTGYILVSIFLNRGARIARFQNDFLSAVSHELRTPLTSISMFIETLRDKRVTSPERQQECLDILDVEVHRLQGLVERLLSLTKMEVGAHKFDLSPISVAKLFERSLNAAQAATLHSDLRIQTECAPNLYVHGDLEALSQALSNLLVNASKYGQSDNGSDVHLTANAARNWVEIHVRDNGPGIPEDEQSQIFEHFERGRTVSDDPQIKGSGLGLAIVNAIVRAHRGRIDVKSQPGAGAEFRIRLKAP